MCQGIDVIMTVKIRQEGSSIVNNNIVHDIAVVEDIYDKFKVHFTLLKSEQRRSQIEIAIIKCDI
jgi:hypothetical protein